MTYRNTGKNTKGGRQNSMRGDKTAYGIQMGLPLYGFGLEAVKTGGQLVHKLLLRQCDRRNCGPFKSNVLGRRFMIYIYSYNQQIF